MAGIFTWCPQTAMASLVEIEGASQAATRFDSQEEAIKAATERTKQNKFELFVYGRDDRIRERNSFGNDPRDIKG